MKKILVFIILLLIIGVIIYNNKVKNKSVEVSQNTNTPASKCGLTIVSPLPGETINFTSDFTFIVKGIVDNTQREKLGCSWTVFEAQAATMKVLNSDKETIGTGLLTAKDSDWMTDQPTEYEGTVKVTGTLTDFSLLVTENDPSGQGNVDIIEIPLVDGSECYGC